MKEIKTIECRNGELIKVDDDVYEKYSKYNWNVYYQENRRPRVVARVDKKEVNMAHIILKLKGKNKRFSWEFKNDDFFDFRASNIRQLKCYDRVDMNDLGGRKAHWEKIADSQKCTLSDLIRTTMDNKWGKPK